MIFNPSKWLHAFSFMKLSAASLFRPKPLKRSSLSPPLHAPTDEDQTPNKAADDDHDNKYLTVFRKFDRDGDGKISSEEITAYFASMAEPIPHEEAQRVVFEFDADGDGFLGFEEFVRLMEQSKDAENRDDIKMAFEMYEVESGSGGVITAEGVQRMLGRLGVCKSYEECMVMIRAFDLDGNGVLDFDEFKLMMS